MQGRVPGVSSWCGLSAASPPADSVECLVRQLGEAFAVDTAPPEPPPPAAARAFEEPALRGAAELQPDRGPESGCEATVRPHRCAGPGLASGKFLGRTEGLCGMGVCRSEQSPTGPPAARMGTASLNEFSQGLKSYTPGEDKVWLSVLPSVRTRSNGHELGNTRFSLNSRQRFCALWVMVHWHGLPTGSGCSLEISNTHPVVVLGTQPSVSLLEQGQIDIPVR